MNPLWKKIDNALDGIRDYLKSDGGDVRIHRITDEMVVELELLGNCKSCSMSAMTMRGGIEQAIKRAVPEIKDVIAINNEQ